MTSSIFLLVLTSAIFHSLWNFAARKVSGNLSVLWLGLWFGCLALLPGLVYSLVHTDFPPETRIQATLFILATGLIHAVYFFLLGAAYRHGEISIVYPIARGSGVAFTALIAWWLLNESYTFPGVAGIGLVCLGTISLSAHANRDSKNGRSVVLALCVGISIVAYSIVDKIGVRFVPPIVYIWWLFFLSALFLTPIIYLRHRFTVARDAKRYFGYSLIIGIGSIATYLMILFAFTRGPVGYIVAVREFAVVFGTLLGITVLKEQASAAKLIAIGLIVVGTICIRIGQ
ncbi:MAG: EamA family transporter [Proteobacteria bacterium]|nr:EamA family transporter [Pseudomonadota bacterium]